MLTIGTWNINSVRLRADLVARLLSGPEAPDILCLQECKAPVEAMALDAFAALGWRWAVARGQKGYNGVAILSRVPIEDAGDRDWAGLGHARHVAARTAAGVTIHNLYVPAGGDVPDRAQNPKFGHKLDFVGEVRDVLADRPARTILAGDFNIAPGADDVWSHRQLLGVVSHTPVETDLLEAARAAGAMTDVVRAVMSDGKLYSWWSYRARDWAASDRGRRLDHIWASPDLAPAVSGARILREARGWDRPSDHVPVLATFDI